MGPGSRKEPHTTVSQESRWSVFEITCWEHSESLRPPAQNDQHQATFWYDDRTLEKALIWLLGERPVIPKGQSGYRQAFPDAGGGVQERTPAGDSPSNTRGKDRAWTTNQGSGTRIPRPLSEGAFRERAPESRGPSAEALNESFLLELRPQDFHRDRVEYGCLLTRNMVQLTRNRRRRKSTYAKNKNKEQRTIFQGWWVTAVLG